MPSGELDTFRATPVVRGWVKALRLLLGLLFIGTGWLKVSGHNIRDGFGTATGSDPVMPLFNAMFAVRPYWWFLGAGQCSRAFCCSGRALRCSVACCAHPSLRISRF